MGFMCRGARAGGRCRDVHYEVGVRRLGHDVCYIDDAARSPDNPQTFDTSNDFSYAAQVLGQLAKEFGFERRWGVCARYLPDLPTAGLIPEPLGTAKGSAELFRCRGGTAPPYGAMPRGQIDGAGIKLKLTW